VRAQAKARKVNPNLIIVKHPVGGLSAGELIDRVEAAASGLREAIGQA
jgi:hypothetical protein